MAAIVFVLFIAFLVIGGYLTARNKRKQEIENEKPGDQYIRRAYANWKRASAFSRSMALSSAGLKNAQRAEALSDLDWNQLPVEVQLLLASFQFIMETDPGLLPTRQEERPVSCSHNDGVVESASPTKQGDVTYSCASCGEILGVGVDPLAEQFEAAVRDLMSKPSPPAPTSRELMTEALSHDTSVPTWVDDDSEEEKQAGFMRRYQRRPTKNV